MNSWNCWTIAVAEMCWNARWMNGWTDEWMNERFSEIKTLLNTKGKQRLNKYSTMKLRKMAKWKCGPVRALHIWGAARSNWNRREGICSTCHSGNRRKNKEKTQYYNVMFLNGMWHLSERESMIWPTVIRTIPTIIINFDVQCFPFSRFQFIFVVVVVFFPFIFFSFVELSVHQWIHFVYWHFSKCLTARIH